MLLPVRKLAHAQVREALPPFADHHVVTEECRRPPTAHPRGAGSTSFHLLLSRVFASAHSISRKFFAFQLVRM